MLFSGILEIDPMELLNFDEKLIFQNCSYKNFGSIGSNGQYFAYSEKERELYEARIAHLEKETEFLKSMLKKYESL